MFADRANMKLNKWNWCSGMWENNFFTASYIRSQKCTYTDPYERTHTLSLWEPSRDWANGSWDWRNQRRRLAIVASHRKNIPLLWDTKASKLGLIPGGPRVPLPSSFSRLPCSMHKVCLNLLFRGNPRLVTSKLVLGGLVLYSGPIYQKIGLGCRTTNYIGWLEDTTMHPDVISSPPLSVLVGSGWLVKLSREVHMEVWCMDRVDAN